MNRTDGLFPVSLLLLAGCGAGTAGLVAGGGGDSGGSSNALPVLSNFTVESPEVSPARVHFVLSDREGDPARVALAFSVGTKSAQLLTHIEGIAANPTQLASSEDGVVYDIPWHFTEEDGLSKDGSFVDGVRVTAVLENGVQELVLGANGDFGLGNDPPEIESAVVPSAEVDGTVGIAFVVSDTSDDIVRIRIEYDIVGDEPDLGWQPARPALDGSTPDYAFEGIVADREGTPLEFFWDTDFDLAELEHDVQLRLTAFDSIVNGASFETTPFHVDNNAEPIATLHGDLLITNPDERRGIPIPFTVSDEEHDDVEVVFQWRRPSESFPELPATPAEIHDALSNSAQRAALHICTEFPRAFTGIAMPIDADTVELPELASSAAHLLAGSLVGRSIEFLRRSKRSESITRQWASNPLHSPVAVLPVGDGLTAIVLDAPAVSDWRLIEIELATGNVVRELTTGPGLPTVATWERERNSILVASAVSFAWHVDRVDVASGKRTPLIAQSGVEHVGRLRGIASLGTNAALITVGNELVRIDWSDRASPRTATLLDGLAKPWGVVLDPARDGHAYVAEHDAVVENGAGRILSVDLNARTVEALDAVMPVEFGPGFPSPRDLALARKGTRLLAVCDVDGAIGRFELRGVELSNASLRSVYAVDDSLDASARAPVTGEDDLVVLAQPGNDGVLVGGGVAERRTIVAHDVATRRVTVTPAFAPALEPSAIWRMQDSFNVRHPADNAARVFAWDSSDVSAGGEVLIRATPLDSEVGSSSSSAAAKRVRIPIDGSEITRPDGVGVASDVVAADVDADGDLDLVSCDLFSRKVLITWQTRPREFDSAPTVLGGPTIIDAPHSVCAVDIDGDGRLDIASANGDFVQGGAITVFWQSASGDFDPLPDVVADLDDEVRSLELGVSDLDGDGDGDLVLARMDDDALTIYWQSSPRRFSAGQVVASGPTFKSPQSLRTADVDGNGLVDLVTANRDSVCLSVFWQSRSGEFESAPTTVGESFVTPSPVDVRVADLDGDGDLDLAAANSFGSPVVIFWQTSPRQFDAPPLMVGGPPLSTSWRDLSVADVDGDSDLDLVTAHGSGGEVEVFMQRAPGQFDSSPAAVAGADATLSLHLLQDLDGDGRADLVTQDASAGLSILWHAGRREFHTAPTVVGFSAFSVQATDVDRDGDLDLAVPLAVRWNASPRAFDPHPTVLPPVGTSGVTAADIDGDGFVDLATVGATSPAQIYWQFGEGEFDAQPTSVGSAGSMTFPEGPLRTADLDGDGDLDLVLRNRWEHKLAVFWQTSPRVFHPVPTQMGSNQTTEDVRSVQVVDIDLDGDLDLASANAFSLTVFRQTAVGSFAPVPIVLSGHFPSTNQPIDLQPVDIDGDGDVDLASANRGENGTGTITIFRRSGTLSFDPIPVVLEGSRDPTALQLTDLDGDGDLDVACTDEQFSGTLKVFWQVSPGRFDPIPTELGKPGEATGVFALQTADIDGDGDLDLVSSNGRVFWGGR